MGFLFPYPLGIRISIPCFISMPDCNLRYCMCWRLMNKHLVFFDLLFTTQTTLVSICSCWITKLSLSRHLILPCELLLRLSLILFIFINSFMDSCLSQINKIIFQDTAHYDDVRRSDSHRPKKTADSGVCLNQVWVNSYNFPWDPETFFNFKISISQPSLRRFLGFNMGRWQGFLNLILLLRLMPGYDLVQEL